jgi:hypothetical protein
MKSRFVSVTRCNIVSSFLSSFLISTVSFPFFPRESENWFRAPVKEVPLKPVSFLVSLPVYR